MIYTTINQMNKNYIFFKKSSPNFSRFMFIPLADTVQSCNNATVGDIQPLL